MDGSQLDEHVPLQDPTALPRIIGREDALRRQTPAHVIRTRIESGRWCRVLPSTYLTAPPMQWPDRPHAAVTFAGPSSMLSGAAVLHAHGMRTVARPTRVLVLIPRNCGSRSTAWVTTRRVVNLPTPELGPGPAAAPMARAVADHAVGLRRLDDVRAVVAESVQRGFCTVQELTVYLDAGPRQGSAGLRRALDDVRDGAASAPEARAARLLRRAGISGFVQNAPIAEGRFVVDFFWASIRAVLEIDSLEYHLGPKPWRATMDRHLALESLGYSVVHRPPSALREPKRFVDDIARWLYSCAAGRNREDAVALSVSWRAVGAT